MGPARILALGLALAASYALTASPALRASPALAAERPETCPGTTSVERVAGISPSGDLLIEGGTAIRIADIRPPEAGAAASRARAWLASLTGEPVEITRIDAPDRWGRVAARLVLPGAAPVDAAELLVGEGLAIVDAGTRGALCRPDLMRVEASSRAARTGLWQDAVLLAADDLGGLAARTGTFAIVEGRIASVGVRRERTYLNFGRDFSRDFSITLPKRSWASLAAKGVTDATLRGRRVRARGMLEMRRAPGMEVVAADMLEILDEVSRAEIPRSDIPRPELPRRR